MCKPLLSLVCLAALLACQPPSDPPALQLGQHTPRTAHQLPAKALPGGATTHIMLNPASAHSADAFSHPASNLDIAQRARFAVGNSFFSNAWISAPSSVPARDGLGPLFNAAACQSCHIRDGRGHAPASPQQNPQAAVVRIAQANGQADPHYGGQIQTRAVAGWTPEARVSVHWITHSVEFPDGQTIELRRPDIRLSDWADGPPAASIRASLRIAPAMIGLGLLEAIPADAIQAQLSHQAAWGLNGRDQTSGDQIGRFGWKAAQISVASQSFKALAEDLGITSAAHPQDNCSPRQLSCREAPQGGHPELLPNIGDALVFYAQHLAPPARRDAQHSEVLEGEALFEQLGCAACHRPSWITGDKAPSAALTGQQIWPYTDLLLHDMGPGLADGIREGQAGPQDWRTAPLWGLGHTAPVAGAQAGYLHDGRARSLAEAIVWHGGEAQAARDRWMALPASQRRKLIRFLASL